MTREQFLAQRAIMDHVKKHGVTKVDAAPRRERDPVVTSRRTRAHHSLMRDNIGNVIAHLKNPGEVRTSLERMIVSQDEVGTDNTALEYDLEVELED